MPTRLLEVFQRHLFYSPNFWRKSSMMSSWFLMSNVALGAILIIVFWIIVCCSWLFGPCCQPLCPIAVLIISSIFCGSLGPCMLHVVAGWLPGPCLRRSVRPSVSSLSPRHGLSHSCSVCPKTTPLLSCHLLGLLAILLNVYNVNFPVIPVPVRLLLKYCLVHSFADCDLKIVVVSLFVTCGLSTSSRHGQLSRK